MSDKAPSSFKFDPTVNLGHLLSFLGFVAMLVGGWTTLDKRLIVVEEAKKAQDLRDAYQDERASHNFMVINNALTEIKRGQEYITSRIDSRGK